MFPYTTDLERAIVFSFGHVDKKIHVESVVGVERKHS